MIMVYVRMLMALLIVCIAYITLIVFVPSVGESIDRFTGKNWNAQLTETVQGIFSHAKTAQDALENRIDNPAPNTTRNIEGRTRGE